MTPLLAQRLRPDRSFERIYERHVADVYRYTLAVLRNPADAEDVTQTTFMNAYRAYQRGERPRAAQNWLIAIAHNVCRQRFRQSQRRVEEVSFDENVAESLVPDEDAPTAEDIRRALGHLAFNQRSALVMRELEGRSYTEISEILGVSTSAVETLIFRARRALREQLEGSLSCSEAELAISRQLDGRLPRPDRGPLRAHLRQCAACAGLARRQRAQRSAIRALAAVPLPSSLSTLGSLFGGGAATGGAAAALGGGVAVKAAAVVAAGALAGGGVYEGVKRAPWRAAEPEPRRQALESAPTNPVARSALGTASPVVRRTPPRRPSLAPPRAAPDRAPVARKPKQKKAKAKTKTKTKTKTSLPRGRALGRVTVPPVALQQELPPAVAPKARPTPKRQRPRAAVEPPRPARTTGVERPRPPLGKRPETPAGRGQDGGPLKPAGRSGEAPDRLRVPEQKPK